jgi:opacity protein-like surface antigen
LDIYQAFAALLIEDLQHSLRPDAAVGMTFPLLVLLESTMNKLLLAALTASAACVTPLAQAQAHSFEGFGIGLGVASSDTTTAYVHGGAINSTDLDSNGILQLQYNAAVNQVLLMGFGATANVGDLKAGNIGSNPYKLKDAYSLYIAPGYAFSSEWMGYGKLAYLNARLTDSLGHGYSFDNGWGYGIGVQTMFSKNWFGQLEYMFNEYADRTPAAGDTLKLKSSAYALTAGYKF